MQARRAAWRMPLWALLLVLAFRSSFASTESNIIIEYIRAFMSGEPNADFGQSTTNIGDIDFDGATDMAVGSPRYGSTDQGEIVIMFLKDTGAWTSYVEIEASELGLGDHAQFGVAIAGLGDLDSDGVNDMAVSSLQREGEVHILQLTTAGAIDNFVTLNGTQVNASMAEGARFGAAVATVGDWDSNGVNDLVVSAPGFDSGTLFFLFMEVSLTQQVLWQSATSLVTVSAREVDESLVDMDFGASVAVVQTGASSDILIVGAPETPEGGALWILYLKKDLGLYNKLKVNTTALRLRGGDQFGASVCVVGNSSVIDFKTDFDSDDTTIDLAVGAPGDDTENSAAGAVYVMTVHQHTGDIKSWHKISNFDEVPYFTSSNSYLTDLLGKSDQFGAAITSLGDLDGNGYADINVGVPGYSKTLGNNRGGAWLTMFLQELTFPTPEPTAAPTISFAPTMSQQPSPHPSVLPTLQPTPSPTVFPSPVPTLSTMPTSSPTTSKPTLTPPSPIPTTKPTPMPTTPSPSHKPTTPFPSMVPIPKPTESPVAVPAPTTLNDYQEVPYGPVGIAALVWCCIFTVMSTCVYTFIRGGIRFYALVLQWCGLRSVPVSPGSRLVERIPVTAFNAEASVERDTTCSICLSDMQHGENVKELACGHCYHPECIDQWLLVSPLCPLCKREAQPVGWTPPRLRSSGRRPSGSGGGGGAWSNVPTGESGILVGDPGRGLGGAEQRWEPEVELGSLPSSMPPETADGYSSVNAHTPEVFLFENPANPPSARTVNEDRGAAEPDEAPRQMRDGAADTGAVSSILSRVPGLGSESGPAVVRTEIVCDENRDADAGDTSGGASQPSSGPVRTALPLSPVLLPATSAPVEHVMTVATVEIESPRTTTL